MPDVWLHVREENTPALKLYLDLGFVEQARRTTWTSHTAYQPLAMPEGLKITSRKPDAWKFQEAWLQESYPPELRWNLPLREHALKPGIAGSLYRFRKGALRTAVGSLARSGADRRPGLPIHVYPEPYSLAGFEARIP